MMPRVSVISLPFTVTMLWSGELGAIVREPDCCCEKCTLLGINLRLTMSSGLDLPLGLSWWSVFGSGYCNAKSI